MKCDVTIHDWSEGKPLTIESVAGESLNDVHELVVAWVNAYAGYYYVDSLPVGTSFRVHGGRTWYFRGPLRFVSPIPTVSP